MLRRASLTVLALVLLPATVQAFDHHHHHHHGGGDGGGGCSSSSTHSSSSTSGGTATAVPAQKPSLAPDRKRVFVTSTTYSGALGGLDGADMYCQTAATEAGLPGTFQAWLSYGSSNAIDRTADVGPWYSTGDTQVFASKADLAGDPQTEILDEHGGYPQSLAGAWTGSDSQGNATADTCEGWTNATGDVSATTGIVLGGELTWGGGNAPLPCSAHAPLLCFQQ